MSEAPVLLTIAEAKRLTQPVVYGLADDTGQVFYVGKTVSARRRFASHGQARGSNEGLASAVRALGDRLRVVILVSSPPDIDAAEREMIRRHEGTIVNLMLADSWQWAKNSAVPWAAGPRHHSPMRYAAGQCRPAVQREISVALAQKSVVDRCWCEINMLATLPPKHRARFKGWWRIAGPKIAAVLSIDPDRVGAVL